MDGKNRSSISAPGGVELVKRPASPPNIQTLGFPERRQYSGEHSERHHALTETRRRRTLTDTPHPGDEDITQEQFDQLLQWLDPDRDKAAQQYEWIRKRLIKIFVSRGSHSPEELADATINRVARLLPQIRSDYVGKPAHYFSGVANFIWLEWLKKQKVPAVLAPTPVASAEDEELDYECLQKCLGELSEPEWKLVIEYYREEKHAKIDHRKKLAEETKLAMNALRIRACRIRRSLGECVKLCRSSAG